ncbi:hypothetical protein BMS3Bbin06_01471 [bacterium BMS3Bbin06]|nr:hypothetical protein BMS3Bbin06_01471 [bacterium BMS3Bbin06]
MAKLAAVSKWKLFPSVETVDMATEGILNRVPSIAADTVPEYEMSSPRFAPRFIPEIRMSGVRGSTFSTATTTQSVGVPFTV